MKTFLSFSRSFTWQYGEVGGKRSTGKSKRNMRGMISFQLGFNVLMKRYFPEVYKTTI